MRHHVLLAVVLSSLVSLGAGSRSEAASGPHIGSTKAQVDHAWLRDGSPCFGGVCGYYTWYGKALWINVSFTHSRAAGFGVAFDPNRYQGHGPNPSSSTYWRLLTGFLPSGARRQTCRSFARTGGLKGPAYACIYMYRGNPILVAHYLTVTSTLDVGTVSLGDNFDAIIPAQ